uniref:inactive dipeptidyl peptidase 10-like n=2 Tax=Pristiophorus japonicus TaxID=55135 RepID=UPI00398E9326
MGTWVSSTRVAVRWLNRAQNVSILTWCEATTGACVQKHRISSGAWLIKQGERPLFTSDGGTFFLTVPTKQGARGEFQHLATFRPQSPGSQHTCRFITSGNWDVTSLVAYDEESQQIYFQSTEESPRTRHLYSADTTSSFQRRCITCGLVPNCTYSDIQFSPSLAHFVLHCQGFGVPTHTVHRTTEPRDYYQLEGNEILREALGNKQMPVTEFHTVRVDTYELPLKLSMPLGYSQQLRPLLLIVDGEPGGQLVDDRFSLDWEAVMAASLGTVVARLDGRGSGYQGLRLQHQVRRRLGSLEVKDQLAAAEVLLNLEFVDQRRVAVFGKAYGGFLTLKLLAATDRLFTCGAAVSPITDFKLYASAFSERYLGRPAREDGVYTVASVLGDVEKLRDQRFLLAHGTADTRIHFQHTAELLRLLMDIEANYTMQVYPDEGHYFRLEKNSKHLQKTIVGFLQDCFRDKLRQGQWAPGAE